jgi:hypothetical protein
VASDKGNRKVNDKLITEIPMPFNIHALDKMADYDDHKIHRYTDSLIDQFLNAPEGKELSQTLPEIGFWISMMIEYGYTYADATPPKMEEGDIKELLTEIFPRKVSLSEPDDANGALDELKSFWRFLQREYALPKAKSILAYLDTVKEKDFKKWMFDPRRAGMAKSFFLQGKSAGFDMTDEKQANQFITLYNLAQVERIEAEERAKKEREKEEKKKQKAEKAARKRHRKH